MGGYCSEIPMVMHSCGHDAHTAILLAVAEWIVENQDNLCGKFKFVFQPSEEGVRGGLAVANGGFWTMLMCCCVSISALNVS